MNATFEAWLLAHVPTAGWPKYVPPDELLQAFVREVNARAEAKMLQTGKHFRHPDIRTLTVNILGFRAMRELLREWGIEE